MKLIFKNIGGSAAVEFTLILPFAALVLISVFAMSFLGIRGIVAQLASMQAARVASTFQEENLIQGQIYAALPPQLFRDGSFEIKGNEENAMLELSAFSNSALSGISTSMSALKRTSPVTPALPPNLGNAVLQGGDTPSSYCRDGEGYNVCD
ncbi:MAG: TadE family protein [Pseudomonadota bacterium]